MGEYEESKAIEIRDAVMAELGMRGGFDNWFDSVDSEIREEILESLRKVIQPIVAEICKDLY